ncbi:hypothetical protein UFOVP276_27 [uncultured Caudovirales phage]|uniref:Uncharacterized protein n=1 Tax=uncultured Caudovirales phage TaxID=2100421 RepID=A0A6J5LB52_9CAUD|nr:hypothetical protein UFOVP127_164 [uncultured Caudovirales phage]CAB4134892.1 hypothetical protein UFOVP276_27 [uncultured Caudovirales phage]
MATKAEELSRKLAKSLRTRNTYTHIRAREEYGKLLEFAEEQITKYYNGDIDYGYSTHGVNAGLMSSELQRMLVEDGFTGIKTTSPYPRPSGINVICFEVPLPEKNES